MIHPTKTIGNWTLTMLDESTIEVRSACTADGYDDYDRNKITGMVNDAFFDRYDRSWGRPRFSVDEESNQIVETFELRDERYYAIPSEVC